MPDAHGHATPPWCRHLPPVRASCMSHAHLVRASVRSSYQVEVGVLSTRQTHGWLRGHRVLVQMAIAVPSCRVESTALRLRAVRQGRARLAERRAFLRSKFCGAVRSRPDSPARRARAFLRASPCFKHAELVQMDLMHHRPSDTGSQKQHGLRGSLLRQGRIKTEATAPAAVNGRCKEAR